MNIITITIIVNIIVIIINITILMNIIKIIVYYIAAGSNRCCSAHPKACNTTSHLSVTTLFQDFNKPSFFQCRMV